MTWRRTGLIATNNISGVEADDCLATIPGDTCETGGDNGLIDRTLVGSILFSNMNVKYFKINLESTKTNMYGESVEKWYYQGINVRCSIDRGATGNNSDEFGVSIEQTITVSIPKGLLQSYNFLPEVGDILMDRERYYEVNSMDVHFVTIPGVGSSNGTQGTTGQTVMYVLSCHLTRVTKINLIEYYQ